MISATRNAGGYAGGSSWGPQGFNFPLDVRRSWAFVLRKFCNISIGDMFDKEGRITGADCCWIRVAQVPSKIKRGQDKTSGRRRIDRFDAPRFVWGGSGLLRGRDPPLPHLSNWKERSKVLKIARAFRML